MAYDEGLAELLRGEFGDLAGVSEKKMYGNGLKTRRKPATQVAKPHNTSYSHG